MGEKLSMKKDCETCGSKTVNHKDYDYCVKCKKRIYKKNRSLEDFGGEQS